MKKAILIIILILSISCGSRKVKINKTDSVIKEETFTVTEVDGVKVTNNNVFIKETIDELIFEPIDTTKPIIVNNTVLKNVVVKTKKVQKEIVDTTKIELKEVVVTVEDKKVDNKIKEKVKETEREALIPSYLWILLIPFFMYIWKIVKKILI